jgi:flagellar biosynthesis/type III secretory pathway chaperone
MATNDPAAAANLLALLDCLAAEERALLAEDLSQIESTLERKRELLARVAESLRGKDLHALPAAWRKALARAQALNKRNAITLGPRLLFNNAKLRFLQAALGSEGMYAANGMSAPEKIGVAPGQRV